MVRKQAAIEVLHIRMRPALEFGRKHSRWRQGQPLCHGAGADVLQGLLVGCPGTAEGNEGLMFFFPGLCGAKHRVIAATLSPTCTND